MNHQELITKRLRGIDASGIRRVFDLAAELASPINLSIGQPDFDVPEPVKSHAIRAIEDGANSYTQTQGITALREKVSDHLREQFPQTYGQSDEWEVLITSGVSGGLLLALMCCAEPGDEVVLPDPYFVMYKHLITLSGATPVYVDTYPDFQMTAERVEAVLSDRTKMVLFNSPSNPTGTVATQATCDALAALCRDRGVLLLSDEIYDVFYYGSGLLPSPAATSLDTLVLRGFSKTYGMTGWRMGYAAGPRTVIEQMTKLQQYSFVCAPSMVQASGVAALDMDMSSFVEAYLRKRDRVIERLSPHYGLTEPEGAFYAFVEVPKHLNMTGQTFVEEAVKRSLLIIPGHVFSQRDTHFRLSYACDDAMLERGLDVLVDMAT